MQRIDNSIQMQMNVSCESGVHLRAVILQIMQVSFIINV